MRTKRKWPPLLLVVPRTCCWFTCGAAAAAAAGEQDARGPLAALADLLAGWLADLQADETCPLRPFPNLVILQMWQQLAAVARSRQPAQDGSQGRRRPSEGEARSWPLLAAKVSALASRDARQTELLANFRSHLDEGRPICQ